MSSANEQSRQRAARLGGCSELTSWGTIPADTGWYQYRMHCHDVVRKSDYPGKSDPEFYTRQDTDDIC
jgi:hypothetical protein